jgi:hypothetical protein
MKLEFKYKNGQSKEVEATDIVLLQFQQSTGEVGLLDVFDEQTVWFGVEFSCGHYEQWEKEDLQNKFDLLAVATPMESTDYYNAMGFPNCNTFEEYHQNWFNCFYNILMGFNTGFNMYSIYSLFYNFDMKNWQAMWRENTEYAKYTATNFFAILICAPLISFMIYIVVNEHINQERRYEMLQMEKQIELENAKKQK